MRDQGHGQGQGQGPKRQCLETNLVPCKMHQTPLRKCTTCAVVSTSVVEHPLSSVSGQSAAIAAIFGEAGKASNSTACRYAVAQSSLSGCPQVMGLLIHGDAAFAGQGMVAELLQMSNVPGEHRRLL